MKTEDIIKNELHKRVIDLNIPINKKRELLVLLDLYETQVSNEVKNQHKKNKGKLDSWKLLKEIIRWLIHYEDW